MIIACLTTPSCVIAKETTYFFKTSFPLAWVSGCLIREHKKQTNDYRIELFDLQQEKMLELAEKENAVNDAKKKFNLLLIQWKNYTTEPIVPASLNLNNPEVLNAYRLELKKQAMELREKKMEVEKKLPNNISTPIPFG